MSLPLSRRDLLKLATAQCVASLAVPAVHAGPLAGRLQRSPAGWVSGRLTGAEALVETLIQEGTACVFGIPGAQENELWDTMKSRHLDYLLVTHEFSAAAMADGYARSTGRPGVICVVPGPGVTNALTGIGEALLDSIPMVCIVGDIANGEKAHAFQVHALPQTALLRPVTKGVIEVQHGSEISLAVRQAFCLASAGEPGPVAVVVPWNLLIEIHAFHCGPLEPAALPFDEAAFQQALGLLSNPRQRVGIYAGLGCMDYAPTLARVAETLQAPVATSISGKGVIPEHHPLAVGWGYGPQGTRTAEQVFKGVDVLLAIGVRYSEVSSGFYSQPRHRHNIHVDINAHNLGRVMPAEVCVHADAGLFLERLQEQAPIICRAPNGRLVEQIRQIKAEERQSHQQIYARCGADPMAFLLTLRRCTAPDALVFVDVTCSQYWATEAFTCYQPRTFFNPTDNQAMGWSIGAALGAQRAHHGRQTITITGDGCFLMSAMEISTAAREHLSVKFFVLDDQSYHYMQLLQMPAYMRTTATILARIDYGALAQAFGVAYQEINTTSDLEAGIRGALIQERPVLVRVVTDYRERPIRWIKAARDRFTKELSPGQKVRFLARVGSRALNSSQTSD